MAKTTSLLQQKLIEKIASIHEMKDNFVSSIEGFIGEADIQFTTLLAVKDASFFVDSYMNVMKVMDQCLNSFVMLTAFADTLQGNFLRSMNDQLSKINTEFDLNHSPEWMQHQISAIKSLQKTDACLKSTQVQHVQPKLPSTQIKHSTKFGQQYSQSEALQPVTKTLEKKDINASLSSLGFDDYGDHTDSNGNVDVYIGNLASNVRQEDVKELVKDFDPIDVRRRSCKEDRRKVFAFVTFRTLKKAEDCIKKLHECNHFGRELKCRLTQSAQKGTSNKQEKDSSLNVSVENDSCYNSLKADPRGNFSVCYPRSMEKPNVTGNELRQKFWPFGDFSEIHFTPTMIFVRFKTKRAAVNALETYARELSMSIANQRKPVASHDSWGKPSNGSFSSHRTEETSHEEFNEVSPSTSSSYQSCSNELATPAMYQQYTQRDKLSDFSEEQAFDSQDEDFSCVLSGQKDNQSQNTASCYSEESDEGIQSSYINQLKKIWT